MIRPVRIVLLALLLGAECPTGPEERTELALARARWARQGFVDYAYDYARDCFCAYEVTRPVTIHVHAGAVVAVFDRQTGAAVPNPLFGMRWPTVPELFDEIDRARREADDLRVTYDPATGLPIEFFADWIERAADDESGFRASNPRRLP